MGTAGIPSEEQRLSHVLLSYKVQFYIQYRFKYTDATVHVTALQQVEALFTYVTSRVGKM